MKKTHLFWFAMLAFLLLGCRNEDFSNSLAESKREEEFFRNNDENTNSKNFNASLVSSTISKLKKINDKTDFISKLSDKTGLPAWNYIAKSKIKTANKGGDGGQILIVPLKVEDGFLSSLMYIKNADSSDPTVYTVTNEQLKDFAENKSIDKDTRESILRTFISFDNAMFGSRLYSSIPSDLFENVPLKENHDHKSFVIGQYEPTQNMDIEQCFMTFHCKNQLEESRCDMCWKCVSITCPLGGGNTDYEPDFPNSPGGNDDGGNDGGGQTNPNIPWYLQNPEIDIFSYSPIVQSVFQSLTDYGIVLHVSQVNYLQENNTIAQRFRTYLASDNSLVKSQNTTMGINFFMDNPGATWQDFLNQVPKTPCENIKAQRENTLFQSKMTDLKGKTSLKKETGYIQKNGGDYEYKDNASATDQNNSLSLPSPATNKYIKGYMHTHVDDFEDSNGYTRIGIKAMSPADVSYFMDLVKNAQDAARPLEDVYAVMVSSSVNYQIRFTGSQYQIKTFTDAQRDAFRDSYTTLMGSRIGNQKLLELGFLQFISEKMNLKGITLYGMNADGTTTEIKLNADKTETAENTCSN